MSLHSCLRKKQEQDTFTDSIFDLSNIYKVFRATLGENKQMISNRICAKLPSVKQIGENL